MQVYHFINTPNPSEQYALQGNSTFSNSPGPPIAIHSPDFICPIIYEINQYTVYRYMQLVEYQPHMKYN